LKNNLDELTSELKNPFKHIRNWIKGEMMGLASLIAAIGEKENCVTRKQNAVKKLSSDRDIIKKMEEGKFVLKNVFKGKNNMLKRKILYLKEFLKQKEILKTGIQLRDS